MCLHIIYAPPIVVKKFQKKKLNNMFLSLIAFTENALWQHNMRKCNHAFHENCASIKILSSIIFVSVLITRMWRNPQALISIPLCHVAFICNNLSLLYGIMFCTEPSDVILGVKKCFGYKSKYSNVRNIFRM
jgi:hypothetical protein